jgi:hypothetical protein
MNRMNRKLLAAYLGLFIGLAEIFMWKEFEVPALPAEYHPSTRKKSDHVKTGYAVPSNLSGRVPQRVLGL